VQAAKQRASERIQAMSDLQTKIYNVLTPQQKTELSRRLAERQARWEKWQQGHDAHGPAGGGAGPLGGGSP
jgi:Spy/CpxP family protein refolding chaperone